jgi:hypothetical protein
MGVSVSIFSVLALSFSLLHAAEEIKLASTGAGLSTLPLEIATRRVSSATKDLKY